MAKKKVLNTDAIIRAVLAAGGMVITIGNDYAETSSIADLKKKK